MMRWLVLMLLYPDLSVAESLVATHTIRADAVLTADDFSVVDADIPGALSDPAEAIGFAAKVTLYAGRPITRADLGTANLVSRNQSVSLVYRTAGLTILTEGRALTEGAEGDVIKVMNLSSHSTVSGTIAADGSVTVGP
jgi:flagellar basal body P-ring formation protein FlgA